MLKGHKMYLDWDVVIQNLVKMSCRNTVCLKKTLRSTFDHHFGKSRPIYKILLLSDSWGNF